MSNPEKNIPVAQPIQNINNNYNNSNFNPDYIEFQNSEDERIAKELHEKINSNTHPQNDRIYEYNVLLNNNNMNKNINVDTYAIIDDNSITSNQNPNQNENENQNQNPKFDRIIIVENRNNNDNDALVTGCVGGALALLCCNIL